MDFVLGLIIGLGVMFFVYANNKKKFNALHKQLENANEMIKILKGY